MIWRIKFVGVTRSSLLMQFNLVLKNALLC